MLLVPIRLDVLFPRLPIMNYFIIGITTLVTFWAWTQGNDWVFWLDANSVAPLKLTDWAHPVGWLGSALGEFG